MNMQIETYEIEDITSEAATMAQDSEAIELCKTLGLTGQLALIDKQTDTRFPYPRMTAAQTLVYGLHCPEHTSVGSYRSGIIPIRILQIIAFLREHPLSKRLEVWHPRDVKTDPILVSFIGEYGGDSYLCARWGQSLLPWAELVATAKPLWLAKQQTLLNGFKSRIKSWEESLDSIADEAIGGLRNFSPQLFD